VSVQKRITVPRTFTVPHTIEGIAGLLTARKWERAAIVYAWTYPLDELGTSKTTGCYTVKAFVNLELAGLRSDRTVTNYRNAWQAAIDAGKAEPIAPGVSIMLPDMEFPPGHNPTWGKDVDEWDEEYESEAEAEGVKKDSAKRVGANKAALAAAIKADPAARAAARVAIDQHDERRAREKVVCEYPASTSAPDAPINDAVGLIVKLRAAKRALQDSLSYATSIRGAEQDTVRTAVTEYIGEFRMILDAMNEVVAGRSMDEELAALLSDESR
jgi:hypothetical protein